MKDRQELIKEELRLFGSSETLEMIASGYNSSITLDTDAGVVEYSFDAYSPTRKEVAKFSLEAKQLGYQTTRSAGEAAGTLELLLANASNGVKIKILSLRQPGKESLARTSIEFPYELDLGAAFVLYRMGDLFEIDELENFPLSMRDLSLEELEEHLKGYLSETAGPNSGDKPQDRDIPRPFKQLLTDMGF